MLSQPNYAQNISVIETVRQQTIKNDKKMMDVMDWPKKYFSLTFQKLLHMIY